MNQNLIALLAALVLTSAACINVGPPPELRSFEPAASAPGRRPAGQTRPLVFDGSDARAHLDVEMVWRISEVELQLAEESRWIAPPDELVADRLRAALFLAGPFRPGSGADPRLTIEVEAFEGILDKRPRAYVAFTASVHGSDGRIRLRRVESSSDLREESGEALARGIGIALDACIAELVTWLLEFDTRS